MYAVVRETSYAAGEAIHETPEFQQFQQAHASLRGYQGTVVMDAGAGRLLTVTLWLTSEDMHAAREAMGPVVARSISPLMTSPSKILGTGPVIVNDLTLADR